MSDRPPHGEDPDLDPTLAVPAAGAGGNPDLDPTIAQPTATGDGGGPPTQAYTVHDEEPPEPPQGNGWRIALVVVLLLIVALLLFLLLGGGRDDDSSTTTTSTTAIDDTTTTTGEQTTTTAATTSTAPPTTPTTAAPSGPSVTSLTASDFTCPGGTLTLTWATTGAVLVEVAIDNPVGVFDTGPANGSMEVPAPCGDDTQTYYVTAIDSVGDRSTRTLVLP